MPKTTPEQNKTLVLEAFDTLFNKRDYAAAEKFWSPQYIQHSAHIPPGREGLFNLIKSLPPTLKYEHGTIAAKGNSVMAVSEQPRRGNLKGRSRSLEAVPVDTQLSYFGFKCLPGRQGSL
jgi:predicted SnoaL-like aldol condensation-catalyzing enzyme